MLGNRLPKKESTHLLIRDKLKNFLIETGSRSYTIEDIQGSEMIIHITDIVLDNSRIYGISEAALNDVFNSLDTIDILSITMVPIGCELIVSTAEPIDDIKQALDVLVHVTVAFEKFVSVSDWIVGGYDEQSRQEDAVLS